MKGDILNPLALNLKRDPFSSVVWSISRRSPGSERLTASPFLFKRSGSDFRNLGKDFPIFRASPTIFVVAYGLFRGPVLTSDSTNYTLTIRSLQWVDFLLRQIDENKNPPSNFHLISNGSGFWSNPGHQQGVRCKVPRSAD
jgi:hypothetical protein